MIILFSGEKWDVSITNKNYRTMQHNFLNLIISRETEVDDLWIKGKVLVDFTYNSAHAT
jgi:hypothetical protein